MEGRWRGGGGGRWRGGGGAVEGGGGGAVEGGGGGAVEGRWRGGGGALPNQWLRFRNQNLFLFCCELRTALAGAVGAGGAVGASCRGIWFRVALQKRFRIVTCMRTRRSP